MILKFENDNATRGTVFLQLSDLKVEPRAQRKLDAPRAHRMAVEFDPDGLGILHVSRRKNGDHYIIDGQHRAAAAREFLGSNGNGQRIECKVYEGLTVAQEARLFRLLNNTAAQSRVNKFLVGITEGHQETLAINRIVEELGLKVGYAQADRTITAVGALQSVYHGFSGDATEKHPELLRIALSVIASAWGAVGESLNGHIIEGLGRLLLVRQRVMDVPDLIKRLSQYPGGATRLIGNARGRRDIMGGKVSVNLSEVVLELYNRGRRANVVEPLR